MTAPSYQLESGPVAYAYRMAGYNRDANYIAEMVGREFSRTLSVSRVQEIINKRARDDARPKRVADAIGEPTESDGLDFDPRLLSFKRKQAAQARRERFEKGMADTRNAPQSFKAYKRWQGGGVKIKLDEIRANKKVKPPKAFSASHLIHAVAQAFYIEAGQLIGENRSRVSVAARAVVARLLRERNPDIWSLSHIGSVLGGRDHSTMSNLLDTWDKRCEQIPAMREVYLMMGGVDA